MRGMCRIAIHRPEGSDTALVLSVIDNLVKGASGQAVQNMAFIVEQAGGAATDGRQRILDIQPTALHQRVGVILGSKNEVDRVTRYHLEPRSQDAPPAVAAA